MKGFSDGKTDNLTNLLLQPKIRLECVDPGRNHNKFYEIETEPALFYPKITKRWGRIGGRKPRMLKKVFELLPDLRKDFAQTLKTRMAHGYKFK